ncbi:MAG: hypothetical protein H0V17_33960 [Deltaproteobacteria bacterium]|nr:hypothetical protein [Deltaproteobacteria bacterium]
MVFDPRMVRTRGVVVTDELRNAAVALFPHLELEDGVDMLRDEWRSGSVSGPKAVIDAELSRICRSRSDTEALAGALTPGIADIVMIWAESACARTDLSLSPLGATRRQRARGSGPAPREPACCTARCSMASTRCRERGTSSTTRRGAGSAC